MLRTGVCELTLGTGEKSPGKKEIAGENGEKRMCRNR